jgi:hypothetical protein
MWADDVVVPAPFNGVHLRCGESEFVDVGFKGGLVGVMCERQLSVYRNSTLLTKSRVRICSNQRYAIALAKNHTTLCCVLKLVW